MRAIGFQPLCCIEMSLLRPNILLVRNDENRGATLVEFLFGFLIVVVLIFACLEFSRMILANQEVATIGRVAANAAYRECPFAEPGIKNCLDKIRNQVEQAAHNSGKEDLRILLSMFLEDGSVGPLKVRGGKSANKVFVNKGKSNQKAFPVQTKYFRETLSTNVDELLNTKNASNQRVGAVVVAEVFYHYEPLISFIPGIEAKGIYESTIY